MESKTVNESYYIFIDGGDELFVIGKSGKYERNISEAMEFGNKYDALVYVEKHGFQRIAVIRRKVSGINHS